MRNVLNNETIEAKNNISEFSNLKAYLGEDWLNSQIQIESRAKMHPIFWILIDYNKCKKLSNNLDVLNNLCEKFPRIIRKIKFDRDRFNFYSLLTEIEVLAYYYRKSNEKYIVDYEPLIDDQNTIPDGKLIINEQEYFLEILTVFEDENEQLIESYQDEIREKLDSLNNNPFILAFGLEIGFERDDISSFVVFVEKLIKSKKAKNKSTFNFNKDEKIIANITFYDNHNNKGYVGIMNGPVRRLNDAGRIKNKILSKIDQLPINSKNIIIMNLSYLSDEFIDLDEAFLGQTGVTIDTKSYDVRDIRQPNGFIHHEKGKSISCVIGYTKEMFEFRRFYINSLAQKIINIEELDNL